MTANFGSAGQQSWQGWAIVLVVIAAILLVPFAFGLGGHHP